MKGILRCKCKGGSRTKRGPGCTHKWEYQFKANGASSPTWIKAEYLNKTMADRWAIKERDRRIARMNGEPLDDDRPNPRGQTLQDLRTAFLEDAKARGLSPLTLEKYSMATETFVAVLGADTVVQTLTPWDVNRWRTERQDMKSPKRKTAGVSRMTINAEMVGVQGMIRFAGCAHRIFGKQVIVNGQKVPGILKYRRLKTEPRKHRPLTPAELELAWSRLPDPYDLISRITYESLPRLGEVLVLRKTEIGIAKDGDGKQVGWMLRRMKGGEERRCTLPLALAKVLLARPTTGPDHFLFPTVYKPHLPLQVNQKRASNQYRRLFDRLGLRCSHHGFKHTGITAAKDRGTNDKAIAENAGWTSPKQMDTYNHVTDASVRGLVDGNAKIAADILKRMRREPLTMRTGRRRPKTAVRKTA